MIERNGLDKKLWTKTGWTKTGRTLGTDISTAEPIHYTMRLQSGTRSASNDITINITNNVTTNVTNDLTTDDDILYTILFCSPQGQGESEIG